MSLLLKYWRKSLITAKIIEDSLFMKSRLITLELSYPRYIHAELMTHRVFSRNAQSTRAIPVSKAIENLKRDPVEPIFMINQRGMQADKEVKGSTLDYTNKAWEIAKTNAIQSAEALMTLGIHKQVASRLLEPFSNIKVIVSATEWENFFSLRIAPDAQQEICVLATAIKSAMDNSVPHTLEIGEYHLPYVSFDEKKRVILEVQKKISTARCARVSYLNHDNSNPDIDNDLVLHDRLLESKHASAFEHIATPSYEGNTNFRKFKQYRHEAGL